MNVHSFAAQQMPSVLRSIKTSSKPIGKPAVHTTNISRGKYGTLNRTNYVFRHEFGIYKHKSRKYQIFYAQHFKCTIH